MSLNCLPRSHAPAAANARLSWDATPAPRIRPWLISGILLALAAIGFGTLVRSFGAIPAFFIEDGPVELLQAGMLVVCAVMLAIAFLRSSGARALFCLVAAYASIFAVTREIPRCGSAFSGDGACLDGSWKTILVLSASLVALAALIWRRPEWRKALSPSQLRWVWPCFVVVVMLAGAEAAEHQQHVEIEESLELAGYLYLGAFAVRLLAQTRPRETAPREVVGQAAVRRT